jgi:ParB family transcriptional regulator, chromosome partitioning protein
LVVSFGFNALWLRSVGSAADCIWDWSLRLSLLQLIPEVAEAFTEERNTANLIARLPQKSQAEAFEQCGRKEWQDSELHLLPAKHVSVWIQNNLYLALADAPFDREEPEPFESV